jgi:hypothetical protein
MTPRHHVVITGTGRAGTTFLVELLTHLGLETGFNAGDIVHRIHKDARAGLEHDIRQNNCPFVVKSPWFCDYAGEVICRDDIFIEHILIPFRDLDAAAESRRHVSKTSVSSKLPLAERLSHIINPKAIPGGLVHTQSDKPGEQEEILLRQIYKLMLAISGTTIPVTLMRYPRITKDCPYLYGKLKPILQNIEFESFRGTFNALVRPELVHSFNKYDC